MLRLSEFGKRLTRRTGAFELMDDLGRAMGGEQSVLMLGGGNPGRVPEVEAAFKRRIVEIGNDQTAYDAGFGNYPHPAGNRRFRDSLASMLRAELGWDVTADHIALTAGSQAAFFMLFNMFAGESEHGRRRILLPLTPEYVGFSDLGLTDDFFHSERPAIERLEEDLFKYRVDFSQLAIDEKIGAVCVSRPTNPTGNVVTDDELAKLDHMCRAADVPLILDNAYGLPFPNILFTPAEPIWNDNIIYCMSLSKLGLPGVRTGIVIARPEIIEALSRMTAIMNLAVGSVGPILVQPLLDNGEILRLSRDYIRPFYLEKSRNCVRWLRDSLQGVPHRIHKPEGALFLWLWLPELPVPSWTLYERLKARGVIVLSGHYFFPGLADDWPHQRECVRISFAMDEATVRAGVEMIGREIREIYATG
jgi:valine--pyruvate aminotransferase